MSGELLSDHTARKRYRCDAGFTCRHDPPHVIEPGDRYTAEVYPPWLRTQEDPDSPLVRLDRWYRHRYHIGCYGGFW